MGIKTDFANNVAEQLHLNQLTAAIALLGAGVWVWSAKSGEYRDLSCWQLLGFSDGDHVGLTWLDYIHPDDVALFAHRIEGCKKGESIRLCFEYRMRHKNGNYVRFEERISVDSQGQLVGVMRSLDNVFSLEESAIGAINILSQLGSREQSERLLSLLSQTSSGCFSVLLFSVDHFAKIQRLFGDVTCDEVLAKLVRLIRHELRSSDPLARWDVAYFMLILPQTDRLTALAIAQRLRTVVAEAELLSERLVTISVGVVHSQPAETMMHLLERLTNCHQQAQQQHNIVVG